MIEKMKREDFDKVYSIMEQSFPSDEYRPYDEQKDLLNVENFCVYVDESINGFISLWEFNDLVFLEHFAVNLVMRNSGLGSKILNELTSIFDKTICLEVELPEDDLTKRRVAFYERNGFCFNDYDYMQPPISKGKNPVPLRIMTYGGKIDKQRFEQIRDTLYKFVYKCI